jgi:hypothetical protein
MHHKKSAASTRIKNASLPSLLKTEDQHEEDFGMNTYICENTAEPEGLATSSL